MSVIIILDFWFFTLCYIMLCFPEFCRNIKVMQCDGIVITIFVGTGALALWNERRRCRCSFTEVDSSVVVKTQGECYVAFKNHVLSVKKMMQVKKEDEEKKISFSCRRRRRVSADFYHGMGWNGWWIKLENANILFYWRDNADSS